MGQGFWVVGSSLVAQSQKIQSFGLQRERLSGLRFGLKNLNPIHLGWVFFVRRVGSRVKETRVASSSSRRPPVATVPVGGASTLRPAISGVLNLVPAQLPLPVGLSSDQIQPPLPSGGITVVAFSGGEISFLWPALSSEKRPFPLQVPSPESLPGAQIQSTLNLGDFSGEKFRPEPS